MKIEKRLRDLLHLKRTKLKHLYVWYCTNELYMQLYVCLPLIYIYIYTSYIKCNVVTLPKRILTCFIIYRNAISTFLTLFVKYVFEKKLYVLYCMCASPLIYIYISCIKCNVVTFYERILTCFIIYRNAILTFLTLFVKYVFEKKIINFMLKK
jgi:hypothetical protein